jgi:predicted small lipoprotein YifL
MKLILLMIVMVALVGCGKKEPVQPTNSSQPSGLKLNPKPEKETGKEATQPTKPEPKVDPTKHERFLWEFETGALVFSSPAIGSDGTVYVGSNDNKLYAIKTESHGLAKSPWPMRGQNARHTGRAPKKK